MRIWPNTRALSFQIVLALSVLVVTAVVVLGLSASYLSGFKLEEEKRDLGLLTTSLIVRATQANLREAPGDDALAAWRAAAQRTGQLFFDPRVQHSITFYSRDYEVLWSSLPRSDWDSSKAFLGSVRHVMASPVTMRLDDPRSGRPLLVFLAPLSRDGVPTGLLQLVMPLATLGEEWLVSGRLLLFFAIFYAALVIALGVILLRQTIVRPLTDFSFAVTRLLSGRRDIKLPLKDPQELKQLAAGINALTRELAENEQRMSEQIEELLAVNEELEVTRHSLIRAEKLASIGRLAAGVAHEVGNPLSAILGYVELLRQGDLPPEVSQDFLRRIADDTARINAIIKGLLDYSRQHPLAIARLDVNDLIYETIDLMAPQKNFKAITFDVSSHCKPAWVMADSRQLQQVLVNMFLNASQAMEAEGVITVFLERVLYDPASTYRQNANRFHRGDSLITVSVIDQGEGIDEETQERIFDPFFTTKEPGSGTGLGLSVSDKIIDGFMGAIDVHSRKGEGATFTILLPEAKPQPEMPETAPVGEPQNENV